MRAFLESTKARLCATTAAVLALAAPAGWSSLSSEVSSVATQIEASNSYSMAQAQGSKEARKKGIVIKHGWDIMNVSRMIRAQDEINNSPFDGIVFSGGRPASYLFTGNRIPESDIAAALNPISRINFTGPKHNYLIQYVGGVNGGFTGQSLENFLENARRLGRVAGKLGIEGIAFDNEIYQNGDPWPMANACPGINNPQECRRIAFEAGKKWMEAIQEGWPDVRMISFFGPWLLDPTTYRWVNQYSQQNDWSGRRNRAVTCDFLAGIYAATEGKSSQYLDGGEFYALRSEADFANTATWMRYFIPYVTPFFPEKYRAGYHKNMGVAFGLYDDRDHLRRNLPRVNPQIWGSMIRNAKKSADVVWLYTERHDWWTTDGNFWPNRNDTDGYVTQEWLDATRAAIEAD